jgi:glutathione S-transferase
MLKFYYNPISINARRVWIALLEKQIAFEPVLVNLDGDQLQPDFTTINPLQRIPVIIDNGFKVVESLAILDYLEAKYPTPKLIPDHPETLAVMRMVQLVAVNEIQTATMPLTKQLIGLDTAAEKVAIARKQVTNALEFYEQLLEPHPYFAGEEITLAEVVAGTIVPSLPMFGFALTTYPRLNAWGERLAGRASWQQTIPAPEAIQAALPNVKKILERRL